jgi:hypothetical protein
MLVSSGSAIASWVRAAAVAARTSAGASAVGTASIDPLPSVIETARSGCGFATRGAKHVNDHFTSVVGANRGVWLIMTVTVLAY